MMNVRLTQYHISPLIGNKCQFNALFSIRCVSIEILSLSNRIFLPCVWTGCVSWRLWCWKVRVSFKAPWQLESDIKTAIQRHASHFTVWNLQPSPPRLALKVWVRRRRGSGIRCRWACLTSDFCWTICWVVNIGWEVWLRLKEQNRNCVFTWLHCYCVSRQGKRVICRAACWKDGV